MEHQVQGLVLVDNEWVSRPHDVYQIMAHAQQTDTQMREPTSSSAVHVPELGLLSRTIFASPMCKWTLPANIRHRELTDIALIGEDSVQLKEIRDYGHLRHVATKTDFKGRILAARVFGDLREVPITRSVASPLPKNQARHRGRRSMTGDEEHHLPPEAIVLTLTSRTLLFLWARNTQTGTVSFSQKSIRLPAGSSRFDRVGTFLAIDPKRRAMAVAAHEGRFILYKTKTMERWREEIRQGKDTIPIEDERIVSIEGRIMHMDFLSSGSGQDDFHVVLLFIIAHQGKTKITCFDWDSRQDLGTATARTERVLVEYEDHNPSLLIPLSRSPDFLLIFDSHISVYKNVLSGAPLRLPASIKPSILPPLHPGHSTHNPKWVGWSRPARNPEFAKEAFYIAREDGRIMYAERGTTVDTHEAGDWPYRIDTAFACLSVDNTEFAQLFPDVLIAGGAGNEGLLCKVGAWPAEYSYDAQYSSTNQFSFVESIPNWTPLTDFSVSRLSGVRTPYERERAAILVANGTNPHGEISELRHGLHAFVDDSFSGMQGCTGLWVVDYGSQPVHDEGKSAREHYATFAITMPMETLLIRITRTPPENRGQLSGAWEDWHWSKTQIPSEGVAIADSVMRDEETLSACPWSKDCSIQINRNEARILSRPSLHQLHSVSFSAPLLMAASRPSFPFFAIAFREAGKIYLDIVLVSQDRTLVQAKNARHQLDHDPTCIELLDINGAPHVFVSTFDSKIVLLSIDSHGVPSLVLEESLEDTSLGGFRMLCESAVILSSMQQQVLVCATRTGSLLSADLAMVKKDTQRLSWRSVKMGSTSAQIRCSQTDTSVAFVSCGSDFCRVRCSAIDRSGLEIDSIWFSNRINPGYLQSPVTAMYQLPFMGELESPGRNLGGFLFAVAGDQMLFSQLDSDIRWTSHDVPSPAQDDSRAVPRKLPTSSKPTNVMYMQSLRRIVVSTIEAKEERAPPNGYRVLHSSLKLLNVHDDKPLEEARVKQEEVDALSDRFIAAEYSLKNAERVYTIVEWPFVDHQGKKYCLIIVGTGMTVGAGKEVGRRLIFNAGKSGSKLQLQKESSYDYPVYCVAMWGNESTISVVGKTMSLDYFDSQAGRWFKRGSKDLPSPGIHVTVKPPFVYVSTLQHSHICYEIVETDREDRFDFEQVFTDSRERSCTQHLVLDLPKSALAGEQDNTTIVLLTDKKNASISGLYHPSERSIRHASDTVFEACLPRTVVRLQRGDIRPPWRHPHTPLNGLLANDLLGACSDGTIYNFSILTRPARDLLRLIQNLIEAKIARDPSLQASLIKPRSGDIFDVLMNGAEGSQDAKITARSVDPSVSERGLASPRMKHVDGDLLIRWMREGGGLADLLREGTEKDVEGLFFELAGAVGFIGRRGGLDGLVGEVEAWLSDVLMPVL
ncbi:Nn.00g028140.m01.CDS01 [Neocucurbitaria sp. VM-36]